jgi:peptide/nickel transport system ATP-binding protein
VCVMYAGRIVESGTVDDVLEHPMHPYTRGLLDSVPSRNTPGRPLAQIPGMTPSLLRLALPARSRTVPARDRHLRHGSGHAGAAGRAHAALREPDRMSAVAPPLLELRGISRRFEKRLDFAGRIARRLGARVSESTVHALDGVDLAIRESEVVGLVGESGCGKSTLGRIVARILPPSAGERFWKGRRYEELESRASRAERLAVQMIFQDPYASLNPRMRIVDLVGEAPVVHGLIKASEREDYVAGVLERVGMDASLMRRFPHQFSGGSAAASGSHARSR